MRRFTVSEEVAKHVAYVRVERLEPVYLYNNA